MGRFTVQDRDTDVRTPTRHCMDCGVATMKQKPFCTKHILLEDRAKGLRERIEGVELEISIVTEKGAKAVNVNGLVVEEILSGLLGAIQITWRRLVKDHVAFLNRIDSETCDYYLERLHSEGLIEITTNSRGSDVVVLSSTGRRFIGR